MWLMSLVFSLTSALITSLVQQWARRYTETPQVLSDPKARARVHSYLFHSIQLYKVRAAVLMAPTLLHLSVYLFFGGLIIIFHTINQTVATAIDVTVGLSVLGYIVLSILPCIDATCPYRTPISDILWYLWHASLFFMGFCLNWIWLKIIERSPMGDHQARVLSQLAGIFDAFDTVPFRFPRRSRLLLRLLKGFAHLTRSHDGWIRKHGQYLTDGFRKSIINSAFIAPEDADRRIFGRLFSLLALSDKDKLQKLVTHTRELGPDEEVRKRSLLLCLDAIQRIVKSGNIPDLNFVRANFAKIELMRPLWEDNDTSIRVSSRSICALIAREVCLRRSWSGTEEELAAWLTDVIWETGYPIFGHRDGAPSLDWPGLILSSFVYQVLSNQQGNLPTEDARCFKETCAILLDQRDDLDFNRETARRQLFQVVEAMQRSDHEGAREIVDKLRSIFPFLIASPPNAASNSVTASPSIAASESPPIVVSPPVPASESPPVAIPPRHVAALLHSDTFSHTPPLRRATTHPNATPTPHALV